MKILNEIYITQCSNIAIKYWYNELFLRKYMKFGLTFIHTGGHGGPQHIKISLCT